MTMFKALAKNKFDIYVLILIMSLALFFRSWHYEASFNFSAEQGAFSEKALELFRQSRIELIGPPISFRVDNRLLFQGSITYYFQLIFLLLGNFDPVASSYMFTIFGTIMIIPLYLGIKRLSNFNVAVLVTGIYAFMPMYIDYTKFFWNPNFQVALLPILIYMLANFSKNKGKLWLFLMGLWSGALLMFHYQFVLVILLIIIYLIFIEKLILRKLLIYKFGIVVGFLPLIVFELKNNFYNCQTIWFYLKNWNELKTTGGMATYHYYLSIGIMVLLLAGIAIKDKIKTAGVILVISGLLIWDSIRYLPYPSHGFGMIKSWSYIDEEKINIIIKDQKLENFNVVNLTYDTLAQVQKYLLKKDGININEDDYRTNKYLFVINKDDNYMQNSAYEVAEFRPNKVLELWKIDESHNLYLLEKISGPTGN